MGRWSKPQRPCRRGRLAASRAGRDHGRWIEVHAIAQPARIGRTRRAQVAHEARRISSLAQARGLTLDEAREELLRSFPGEIAPGEALMYARGWTVGVVREGLQALAAEEGLESSGLQDVDVWRWLRGEVYPRESLERLCRLFRCHQARLGWPARGNDLPISFGPGALAPLPSRPSREGLGEGAAGREPWAD